MRIRADSLTALASTKLQRVSKCYIVRTKMDVSLVTMCYSPLLSVSYLFSTILDDAVSRQAGERTLHQIKMPAAFGSRLPAALPQAQDKQKCRVYYTSLFSGHYRNRDARHLGPPGVQLVVKESFRGVCGPAERVIVCCSPSTVRGGD